MKKLIISTLLLTSAALAVVACNQADTSKSEDTKANAPAAKVVVESATAAESLTLPELSPEEPKTKLGELPVAEDLEEEAEKSVNLDNIDLELDRLQAEIDG